MRGARDCRLLSHGSSEPARSAAAPAGDEALPFAERHAAGITLPTGVLRLELDRNVMQRVYENRRLVVAPLLNPEPSVTSSAARRRRSRR